MLSRHKLYYLYRKLIRDCIDIFSKEESSGVDALWKKLAIKDQGQCTYT